LCVLDTNVAARASTHANPNPGRRSQAADIMPGEA